MRYQKILLAHKSRHIYEQFCLVTFFVSGYYGKSTVEDVELVWFYRLNRRIWVWKSQIQIFGGKMKFDFLGYFASILTYLEHLDGGEACKIQNKLKFGWKNEIWNIQAYLGFLAKIPKFFKVRINHPKYIFFEFYKTPHHRNALKM